MIGDGIALARKQKGLSQEELGDLIKSDQTYVSRIETGTSNPSLDMVDKIADALDIPTPLIMWFGVKREDVPEENQKLFDIFKPSIDEMLLKIFNRK